MHTDPYAEAAALYDEVVRLLAELGLSQALLGAMICTAGDGPNALPLLLDELRTVDQFPWWA